MNDDLTIYVIPRNVHLLSKYDDKQKIHDLMIYQIKYETDCTIEYMTMLQSIYILIGV